MVRWLRWHRPPDTRFEIRTLAVWGRARYLSPQYWLSHVDGEETFLFLSNRRDPGTEHRALAWKAALLTTTLGPPPCLGPRNHLTFWVLGGKVHLRCLYGRLLCDVIISRLLCNVTRPIYLFEWMKCVKCRHNWPSAVNVGLTFGCGKINTALIQLLVFCWTMLKPEYTMFLYAVIYT